MTDDTLIPRHPPSVRFSLAQCSVTNVEQCGDGGSRVVSLNSRWPFLLLWLAFLLSEKVEKLFFCVSDINGLLMVYIRVF